MSELVIVIALFGSSVVVAYFFRRVARLQEETRKNPVPPVVAGLTAELTTNAYRVSFHLKRLKSTYADPLSALVAGLHNHINGKH